MPLRRKLAIWQLPEHRRYCSSVRPTCCTDPAYTTNAACCFTSSKSRPDQRATAMPLRRKLAFCHLPEHRRYRSSVRPTCYTDPGYTTNAACCFTSSKSRPDQRAIAMPLRRRLVACHLPEHRRYRSSIRPTCCTDPAYTTNAACCFTSSKSRPDQRAIAMPLRRKLALWHLPEHRRYRSLVRPTCCTDPGYTTNAACCFTSSKSRPDQRAIAMPLRRTLAFSHLPEHRRYRSSVRPTCCTDPAYTTNAACCFTSSKSRPDQRAIAMPLRRTIAVCHLPEHRRYRSSVRPTCCTDPAYTTNAACCFTSSKSRPDQRTIAMPLRRTLALWQLPEHRRYCSSVRPTCCTDPAYTTNSACCFTSSKSRPDQRATAMPLRRKLAIWQLPEHRRFCSSVRPTCCTDPAYTTNAACCFTSSKSRPDQRAIAMPLRRTLALSHLPEHRRYRSSVRPTCCTDPAYTTNSACCFTSSKSRPDQRATAMPLRQKLALWHLPEHRRYRSLVRPTCCLTSRPPKVSARAGIHCHQASA
ncbi:hypothetical protein FF011L_10990 [Roseimaritima multifibrata]|uniref:Uncharacterized protein n=1 Tax=Roseimaritima multifibrata TaxID=1930274 RepID=A0A517MC57_9BACT|nr:hypothetical protein FF011L_10990 [Roseimaritima multifibrata]